MTKKPQWQLSTSRKTDLTACLDVHLMDEMPVLVMLQNNSCDNQFNPVMF